MDLNNLPQDIQDILTSSDVHEGLIKISQENRLHIDQADKLESLVDDVILDLINPQDLPKMISGELNVSMDQANKIATDVSEQIFTPIRNSLKQIHEGREESLDEDSERNEMMKAISEQPEIPAVGKVQAPFPDAPAPNITKAEKEIVGPEDFKKPELPANIHEEKLTTSTVQGSSETLINKPKKHSLVPNDLKETINADPYKENIE